MNIKKSDLEFLIELENYFGHNYTKDDEEYDFCLRLINLNERLIQQRIKTNEKTKRVIAERRKDNKNYARSNKGKHYC